MSEGVSATLSLGTLLLNDFISWFVPCQVQGKYSCIQTQVCVKQVGKCYVGHNNVG